MRGPFAVVPCYALELCDGPDAIAVLTLIASHADADGWCRSTYQELGRYLNRSIAWIAGAVRRLKDAGLIHTRKSGTGQHVAVVLEPNSRPPFVQPVEQRSSPVVQRAEQQLHADRRDPPSVVQQGKDAPTTTERVNNESKKRSSRAPNKRAIASDWRPDEDLRSWAVESRHDLAPFFDEIVDDFRRYWIESGETRSSWSLTFKNWWRREAPRKASIPGGGGATGKIDRDESRSRLAAVATRRMAGESR